MMLRLLKSSSKKYSGGMRRSRGPSFDCKKQQKPIVQSVQLRKPGKKRRPRPRKRLRDRGLRRRRRGRKGQGSTSSNSGTRC